VNTLIFSVEYAKMLNQEDREEAAKHRLLRQIEAGQPRVLNHFGLHIGELVMALALALRLR
jgi:hypothetical protein